jgi:pimeloyl-ACP methyl ester carboxylesterase
MHGLSSARTEWAAVVGVIAERHHVFAFDHRGHGESTHTPGHYRIDDYTDDAVRFVEELVGGEAAVVGASLGGLTAAHLAGRRPDLVTCAVLEDPVIYLGDPEVFATTDFRVMFPLMQTMARTLHARGATVAKFAEVIGRQPASRGGGTLADELGDEGMQRMALSLFSCDPEALTPAIDGGLWESFDPDRRIEAPVCVLRAEPALGAGFFAEHAGHFVTTHRDAEVHLVSGASHSIKVDELDVFMEHLTGFLGRHAHR